MLALMQQLWDPVEAAGWLSTRVYGDADARPRALTLGGAPAGGAGVAAEAGADVDAVGASRRASAGVAGDPPELCAPAQFAPVLIHAGAGDAEVPAFAAELLARGFRGRPTASA